ncbi:MAG TPA: hypothetical protein DCE41_19895 [Cytophagales bacterium]|nr:hypothetical protein [Cytophagales bacterium]HAA22671.1 hypothetical protein [Cytophagales bacterium]HAP58017.1 hypothetical protein [Cytophagales bacterium]
MKKSQLWIYRISTGLLSLLMLFSASNYIFNNAEVQQAFTGLGFPVYLIYPMAIAKVAGIIVIWTKRIGWLTDWAYAGFFFNLLLAASAHINAGDGQAIGALMGLVFFTVSFYFYRKSIGVKS